MEQEIATTDNQLIHPALSDLKACVWVHFRFLWEDFTTCRQNVCCLQALPHQAKVLQQYEQHEGSHVALPSRGGSLGKGQEPEACHPTKPAHSPRGCKACAQLRASQENPQVYILLHCKGHETIKRGGKHRLPLHGPQSGAKICYSIPSLFHT